MKVENVYNNSVDTSVPRVSTHFGNCIHLPISEKLFHAPPPTLPAALPPITNEKSKLKEQNKTWKFEENYIESLQIL